MYANEENLKNGKCSYSRYNYLSKINLSQKFNNDDLKGPIGYSDADQSKVLTKKDLCVGKEIYVSIL